MGNAKRAILCIRPGNGSPTACNVWLPDAEGPANDLKGLTELLEQCTIEEELPFGPASDGSFYVYFKLTAPADPDFAKDRPDDRRAAK